MAVELTVDQQALQKLGRALKEEADGKKLRRDLLKSMRQSVEPLKQEVTSNLLSLADTSPADGVPPLRSVVKTKIKAEARLSGRYTGARLKVGRKGMPREFDNAARRLNARKGWRHPVFGTKTWVKQRAQPKEWFDSATRDRANREQVREDVIEVMNNMAERIARKTK